MKRKTQDAVPDSCPGRPDTTYTETWYLVQSSYGLRGPFSARSLPVPSPPQISVSFAIQSPSFQVSENKVQMLFLTFWIHCWTQELLDTQALHLWLWFLTVCVHKSYLQSLLKCRFPASYSDSVGLGGGPEGCILICSSDAPEAGGLCVALWHLRNSLSTCWSLICTCNPKLNGAKGVLAVVRR